MMVSRTVNTATGRRRQLFSPVPEIRGNASRKPMAITGPTSNRMVSILGGSRASAANAQDGNHPVACRTGYCHWLSTCVAPDFGNRREELATTTGCGVDGPAHHHLFRGVHSTWHVLTVVSSDGRVEQCSGSS